VPQSYYFCIKNALKLTYDHLYVLQKKILGSLSLAMKGRDNKRRKGRGVEGREEERRREGRDGGKGREGKGRKGQGATAPQIWSSVLAPVLDLAPIGCGSVAGPHACVGGKRLIGHTSD
jgi:hypothetical protein